MDGMKYFKGSMTLRESVSLSLLAGTGLLILVMAWILNKFTYISGNKVPGKLDGTDYSLGGA